jgi:hypothetical protein
MVRFNSSNTKSTTAIAMARALRNDLIRDFVNHLHPARNMLVMMIESQFVKPHHVRLQLLQSSARSPFEVAAESVSAACLAADTAGVDGWA